MKGHVKYFIRGMVLLLLVVGCLTVATRMMIPKYYYNDMWPVTSTYQGFYQMEEGTIDVLFLGSSHAASAFDVQRLYNKYGITAYNLGCEEQNLLVSYYWLKEALRFQSPEAVILDLYTLFEFNADDPLNTSESHTRKAMDYMKWSSVKADAVGDICEIDENQTRNSYYFPNIRFHTRWSDLSEGDFTDDLSSHFELKGFCPFTGSSQDMGYKPFQEGETLETTETVEVMQEYLNRIIELCSAEGIGLILVKTPVATYDVGRYYTSREIAKESQLAYYDFNNDRLYDQIGFEFATDMCDSEHLSISGAEKVTDFLGERLIAEYGLEARNDPQWEETKDFYEMMLKGYEMVQAEDIYTYLDLINQERYSIFLSIKERSQQVLDGKTGDLIKDLGFAFPFDVQQDTSYLAVRSGDEIYEETGCEMLKYHGTIRDGAVTLEMISAGADYGNISSIVIDGIEYSQNQKGLNIVVYDNLLKKIVHSTSFDI